MSELLPEFEFVRPKTIEEALEVFKAKPQSRFCAGGTDLVVNMRRGFVDLETLIDLTSIPGLKNIDFDQGGLHIGAGVTLRTLTENSQIATIFPAVAQAAGSIAGPNHRETATAAGNLCLDTRCLYLNQSHWWRKSNDYCLKYKGDICHVAPKGNRCRAAFSGDLAPALLVYDAQVDLIGPEGSRRIPLKALYKEDGADHLSLRTGELLISIFVPSNQARSAYEKIRVRGAIDFPLAGVAVSCEDIDEVTYRFKLAITGTNSMPIVIDVPDLTIENTDPDAYFQAMGKLIQKAVSPQRTTTIAPHYRRLSIAALAARIARGLLL
ncbi:MAG: 4-hydroxybenzoyl-CoA reductase subunit beta [Hyphomicrobiales bacterium]|nr:4-hydroxybenzoyl-CoA reductase subunit beta [Hyphomicrobiales bacterium]